MSEKTEVVYHPATESADLWRELRDAYGIHHLGEGPETPAHRVFWLVLALNREISAAHKAGWAIDLNVNRSAGGVVNLSGLAGPRVAEAHGQVRYWGPDDPIPVPGWLVED